MMNELICQLTNIWGILVQTETKSLNNISFNFQNQFMDDAASMSIVGMVVVYFALILIAVVIAIIAKVIKQVQLNSLKIKGKLKNGNENQEDISGEINAAISLALNLYFAQVHDQESTVLTIERVPRPYAPWSSKIYNIRKHV
jgi:glutaconyl-CoA/methylmalonyl-CoA decarboxylase subunit delta